ncbi:ABC transporter ATP-binding protein [Roseicella frigidaeris]|uniref:Sulfonate ABC transporter ATP-binding protein n=1 Tax=Roseicella frigidaeris TaxID=2230885 RepID=A0A327MAF8_9PROT|nr:ATP-binding cassette domain-containing protein [Roseicella frigidaeris]RAI57108.1 sulfonate ABC transporter ATP-binding protein [Roseicella frigidaeris]
MPDPVLRLSRFTRRFHGPAAPPVLDRLDLTIPAGEFVALLGRSGSGKTTLLRTLAGLDPVTEGTASLPARRAVVFQEPRLLPWKPVWRNVALGLPGEAAVTRQRALAALQEVELSHRATAWPLTLSGGEAQRVGLARALVREPELLLLDEPFAALDALTRLRMQSLVGELWQRHRPAVLLVTHDVEEALLLADRVLVLAAGRLVEDLAVDLPRPRRRAAAAFDTLRVRLLATLGVDENGHDATARAA